MEHNQFIKNIIQSLFSSAKTQPGEFIEPADKDEVRVGLDIGSSSIKILEIAGTAQGPAVQVAVNQEFARPLDPKGSMPEETLVLQSLVDVWHKNKLKGKDVRLVISDPGIYLRHVTIPVVEHNELSKAVKWQIEKFVPFPIDDASVDYQVIENDSKADKTQMAVIVVAVERKIIDKYLRLLKALKIVPSLIDIAPFSIAKAVMKMYGLTSKETILIVDIGFKTTSMVIVQGKNLLMVRSIETAGDQFTRVISESCGVDRATAEKVKREYMLSADNINPPASEKVASAIVGLCGELVKEIERSFAYCERESLVEGIDKIVLCGGGANLNGLDKFISRQLGLPVEVADISKHVSGHKEFSEPVSAQFVPAYGGTLNLVGVVSAAN